jgi:hypothetical protein
MSKIFHSPGSSAIHPRPNAIKLQADHAAISSVEIDFPSPTLNHLIRRSQRPGLFGFFEFLCQLGAGLLGLLLAVP